MSNTEKRLFIAGITYFNSNDNSNAIGRNFRQMVAIQRMNHKMHTMDEPLEHKGFCLGTGVILQL